jgi:hypothetical protein
MPTPPVGATLWVKPLPLDDEERHILPTIDGLTLDRR